MLYCKFVPLVLVGFYVIYLIVTKTEMAYQVFSKFTIIKFEENPSSTFQVVTCVQADVWSDLKDILQGYRHAQQHVFLFKRERTVLLNVRLC
jgi:hypothetical protein